MIKLLEIITEDISRLLAKPFKLQNWRQVSGGSINSAFILSGNRLDFFVKTNHRSLFDMFQAERDGLQEIADARAIKVPDVLGCGISNQNAYIIMQYIEFCASSSRAMEKLGLHLANLHRVTRTQFGWHRNNTIGSTHQENSPDSDWCRFWANNRFGFQIELIQQKQPQQRSFITSMEKLIAALPSFFNDYHPEPSLLHGDLWSGNYAVDTQGEPVIFDPAVYFGDREADIAMTELFGGFPAAFYQAYNEAYALDQGYSVRKTLYNLYHILNHYTLFGGGYLSQAETMAERLLSEVN